MDAPDKRAFEADVAKAAFRLGAAEGYWRLVRIEWPIVLVAVVAGSRSEYVLRLDCSNYPQDPPTGGPWDLERDAVLEFGRWPQGKRISKVFRTDWMGGAVLYMPCDRVSIAKHPDWRTKMPSKIWRPKDGITQHLEFVHELLND